MLQQFIDFEWLRDPKGRFELVPAQMIPNPHNSSVGILGLGTDSDSEFVERPSYIVWKGSGPLARYEPLDNFGDVIVEQFADIKTPTHVLDFVKRFGFLHTRGWSGGRTDREEQVDHVLERAGVVREIAAFNKRKGAKMTAEQYEISQPIRLRVAPSMKGATVRYSVRDLDAAISLQFILNLAGGVILKTCRSCSSIFTAGPGHRRADSKYCSEDCQIKFKSRKPASAPNRKD